MPLSCTRLSATVVMALSIAGLSAAIASPPASAQECNDPSPKGGGELEFTFYGFLSENHFASRQGDVCPDATEAWSFTNFGPPVTFDQYIAVRVTLESGSASVLLGLPDGQTAQLEPGAEYRALHRAAEGLVTYHVRVNGEGKALVTYRVEACRSAAPISGPCALEPRGLSQPIEQPTPHKCITAVNLSPPQYVGCLILPTTGRVGDDTSDSLRFAVLAAAGAALLAVFGSLAFAYTRDG